MTAIGEFDAEQLAAFICQRLCDNGVTVTLTGGACVGIWSDWQYVSHDLDFIEEGFVSRKLLRDVLLPLGFVEQGRHFVHPASAWMVEFPTGPLMVGDERVEGVTERRTAFGMLRLLTPTDCVKDRLAAFFHWNDRQSLAQALLVATTQKVDLAAIRRWSAAEGQEQKFRDFAGELKRRKKA